MRHLYCVGRARLSSCGEVGEIRKEVISLRDRAGSTAATGRGPRVTRGLRPAELLAANES